MEKKYTYYQEVKSEIHMLYAEEIAAVIAKEYFPELSSDEASKETRKQLQRIEKKRNSPKIFYNTKRGLKRVYSPETISELIAYYKTKQE